MQTELPCNFATQITESGPWSIFEAEDYYGDHVSLFFGVHGETGEVRTADVTGRWLSSRPSIDRLHALRKLADLGFPPRTGCRPHQFDEIDAMHSARFGKVAAE